MHLFLDTGNIDEIREITGWGVVDGVTTNPTLLAREADRGDYRALLKEICDVVKGPVSAEVTADDAEGMLRQAKSLVKISEHIIIKVPCTAEGLAATSAMFEEGIRVNMTLVFSPLQAVLAANAGASYVSPFVGRLDDIGHEGVDEVEKIRVIFDNYDIDTQIIFASTRHPEHVLQAALIGADICTMPAKVFRQMVKHPLTDKGIERFLSDWKKTGFSID
ncbi:fructose-6-phosphate aldolase [candidate division WOR-3 bacterium]|uniref:Probable transaldolase n=1 Tax=candidate division WOR-3 bacterium TaxID=2052148 RepID=A0A9D5QCR8_UNCW3|nr:fructose-6-phosphate aldolase [candidate division WOR-3 bacterium]MBD3364963.1 fructose-6-phosphate aldolase [candidate division WOR-3 bacterium]